MHDHAIAEQSDALRLRSLDDLNRLRKQILDKRDPDQPEIVVCHGTGCLANGSADVSAAIRSALDESGIDAKVFRESRPPGARVLLTRSAGGNPSQGIFYQKVKPKDAQEIIEKPLSRGCGQTPALQESHGRRKNTP